MLLFCFRRLWIYLISLFIRAFSLISWKKGTRLFTSPSISSFITFCPKTFETLYQIWQMKKGLQNLTFLQVLGSLRWQRWGARGGDTTDKPPNLTFTWSEGSTVTFILHLFTLFCSSYWPSDQRPHFWASRGTCCSVPNFGGFMKNLKMLMGNIDQKVLKGSRGRLWDRKYKRQVGEGRGKHAWFFKIMFH